MNSKELENLADRLLAEYEEGRRDLNDMRESLDPEILEDKEDRSQINRMISSMTFSIDWMRTGRMPGSLRGIDRRSAYQRRALIDMDLFPSLDIQPEERVLTQEERESIIDVLIDLSHRERQCYLLHIANGLSLSEIGKVLGISKRTAQQYVDRAKKKIGSRQGVAS
ncbi:sigma-70 family RNA polymerase sigma factor [Virgibacillus oceani]